MLHIVEWPIIDQDFFQNFICPFQGVHPLEKLCHNIL